MTDFSILQVYTEDKNLFLTSRFYDGTITPTGGGAGFQSVARPQNTPLTAWRGPENSYTMEIPLILDVIDNGKNDGGNIESRCRVLEKMYGALTSPVSQPPLLILNARGALQNDVINFPPLRWVIPEEPTYSDQLRDQFGKRTRQVVTVKFMKYTAYDELTRTKSAATGGATNTIRAKGNDTWRSIAARTLNSYGGARWANYLAQFNGARDGAARVSAGQLVKIPTAAQVKQWESTPRR